MTDCDCWLASELHTAGRLFDSERGRWYDDVAEAAARVLLEHVEECKEGAIGCELDGSSAKEII